MFSMQFIVLFVVLAVVAGILLFWLDTGRPATSVTSEPSPARRSPFGQNQGRVVVAPRDVRPPAAPVRDGRPPAVAREKTVAKTVKVPPLFELEKVCKEYESVGERPIAVLRSLSIEIKPGVTAIVGPSGGGKTTTLNCIGGLDAPTSGEIVYRGEYLDYRDDLAMRRFRANEVAWVFQDLNLIGHQTVLQNVALPLICQGFSRREADDAALENLFLLGMDDYGRRRPWKLSRGQKQRVAIARAFTSQAGVILADEPTGSLDWENAEKAMAAFQRLSEQSGKSVILVTHDERLLSGFCNHVLRCVNGVMAEDGPAQSYGRQKEA